MSATVGDEGRPGRPPRAPGRLLAYLAAALLALLVPLILAAGLWVRSELAQSQRDLEQLLTNRGAALAQRVDAALDRQTSLLRMLATLPSLDEPDLLSFCRVAERMAAAMPQWARLELFDAESGRALLSTDRPLGAVIPSNGGEEVIRRVVEEREPVIAARLKEGGENLIVVNAPVVRDGQVRLVLAASLRIEALQELLTQEEQGPKLISTLVDDQGRILARSQSPAEYVGRMLQRGTLGELGTRATGLFSGASMDGSPVHMAFKRLGGTGWFSIASIDQAEFDALSKRAGRTLMAAGALSLTLAVVLAVVLFSNVMEQRVVAERQTASDALRDLDARLLATTREALAEQRKASSEREVLLREIYHRVKNNLQIIQSLLRLGSRDLDAHQREPFENAVRRIGAMARVHTLLYESADLASIDLKDYLEGLVKEIAEASGAEERRIETVVDVPSMRVALDQAVPLAFIAVEILTNAFKHAFPAGRPGTVRVTAEQRDGHGVLTVADNGVGVANTPKSKGSLGLAMVARLAQQIGGTVSQPDHDQQSVFRIEFPLKPAGAPPLPA